MFSSNSTLGYMLTSTSPERRSNLSEIAHQQDHLVAHGTRVPENVILALFSCLVVDDCRPCRSLHSAICTNRGMGLALTNETLEARRARYKYGQRRGP
ncbi:hypothetical protein OOU_Y34scaffold01158g5 [Pyricularia oryzae Y34]|uniref:Uncharacterized protein n=2 Tax=Pyricularia oryzae TaxID=318829 RepID=A0AA97NLP6_PYRO3|nr:hypothetical protein OOU_Y34scaffold01158g5 [Pyricularia oryzae Y34]